MSLTVWSRTCEKKKLSTMGASTQPFFTPLEMAKKFKCSAIERTCPVMLTSKRSIIGVKFRGQPSLRTTDKSNSMLTMLKPFVRSMNTAYSSICYSMHFSWICRTVNSISMMLRPDPNPHWATGRLSLEKFSMSLLRSILAKIFPAIDNKKSPSVVFAVHFCFFVFI